MERCVNVFCSFSSLISMNELANSCNHQQAIQMLNLKTDFLIIINRGWCYVLGFPENSITDWTKPSLIISSTWLISKKTSSGDVWSLCEDGYSLTKGTTIWVGAQEKPTQLCVLRVAGIQAGLGAEEAQDWLSSAADTTDPHLKQSHSSQTTAHAQHVGAEQGQRSLVLAITAHLAMVWDTQPQAKLSKTRTWKKITYTEATKGLIFKMVAPINVSSAELKTSAKLKA